MRRVNLLPVVYAERRRQQQQFGLVLLAGLFLLLLLIGWYFLLGSQINSKESELTQIQSSNAQLQAQIDELQRFADLDNEVRTKEQALVTVMAGDVDWPAVMTEVALVIPGEIWLTDMSASAGSTEGAAPVGTETAPIRVSGEQAFGRIQFIGRSLSMPGIGKWLVRLGDVKKFHAVWLNDATEADAELGIFTFDNTVELGQEAASKRRFDRETP